MYVCMDGLDGWMDGMGWDGMGWDGMDVWMDGWICTCMCRHVLVDIVIRISSC